MHTVPQAESLGHSGDGVFRGPRYPLSRGAIHPSGPVVAVGAAKSLVFSLPGLGAEPVCTGCPGLAASPGLLLTWQVASTAPVSVLVRRAEPGWEPGKPTCEGHQPLPHVEGRWRLRAAGNLSPLP